MSKKTKRNSSLQSINGFNYSSLVSVSDLASGRHRGDGDLWWSLLLSLRWDVKTLSLHGHANDHIIVCHSHKDLRNVANSPWNELIFFQNTEQYLISLRVILKVTSANLFILIYIRLKMEDADLLWLIRWLMVAVLTPPFHALLEDINLHWHAGRILNSFFIERTC